MLGDINDFEFSATTDALDGRRRAVAGDQVAAAVRSVTRTSTRATARSWTRSWSARRSGDFDYDSVHINAEFADQISDHDPQVLRFEP